MTRQFTEGFEGGHVLFFTATTGTVQAVNAALYGLTGAYCAYISYASTATRTFTALTECYWRVRMSTTSTAQNVAPCIWYLSNAEIGRIRFELGTGRLQILTGGTVRATGPNGFLPNTAYLIEVHIKHADVGGLIEVKVDGSPEVSYSGDTKPGSEANFDNIRMAPSGTNIYLYVDDIAMNDTNNADGLNDNSWCGAGHVLKKKAAGNGDRSELTGQDGNSVDNYLNVDDIPHDSDTTYNESAVVDQADLYTLEALDITGNSVLRLWPEAVGRDTVAAGGAMQLGIKPSGGSEDWSTNISLLTTYTQLKGKFYKTNPNGGGAWNQAALDALQAGPKVK